MLHMMMKWLLSAHLVLPALVSVCGSVLLVSSLLLLQIRTEDTAPVSGGAQSGMAGRFAALGAGLSIFGVVSLGILSALFG